MAKSLATVTQKIRIDIMMENFPFFIIKSANFKENLLLGLNSI